MQIHHRSRTRSNPQFVERVEPSVAKLHSAQHRDSLEPET
jgi:beta-lactamase superfamily II metal-dependent hydrolase